MKNYIFLSLLVLGLPAVLSQGKEPIPLNRAVSELERRWGYGDYKECGGVLPIATAPWTYIKYKEGRRLAGDEFCVWTLLPEEDVETIQLEIYQNIFEVQNGLTAYFWNSTTGLTALDLPRNRTTVKFSPPPLFLSLSTFGGQSNGIRIDIYSFSGPRQSVSTNKDRAFHLEIGEGYFSYPQRHNKYLEGEPGRRVSVVVTGAPTGQQQIKKVTLRDVSLEPGFDSVEIYTLLGYYAPRPGFFLKERLTANKIAEYSADNYYPTVMIFNYKNSIAGKEFTIEVSDYPHKQLINKIVIPIPL